eukprot:gene11884-24898_t
MVTLILLLLLFEIFTVNGNYPSYPTGHISEPTDEEIGRAIVVRPTEAWGYFMRQENSIRLLLIGGSNTAVGVYGKFLEEYIVQNISSISAVKNLGVGGTGPDLRLELPVFGVEHLPPSKWPNLVLLEYCVNSINNADTAILMDQLINLIKDKWTRYKAQVPSFIILELFCIVGEYDHAKAANLTSTPQDRVQALNTYDPTGINLRGAGPGMYHISVARFYQIPYISITDAIYPAFSRHFIANDLTEEWAYNPLGCHLSIDGYNLIVDRILGPFLREQMKPHSSDALLLHHKHSHHNHSHSHYELQSIYDHNLRMHHPEVYEHSVIDYWVAWHWATRHDLLAAANFVKIFPETEYWKHAIPPNYAHAHYCFLSSERNSVAKGFISAPSYCNHTHSCKIDIGYLRSWNDSYIGNIECSLYSINEREGDAARIQIEHEHLVNGSVKHNGGTILSWDHHMFKNVPPGFLTIECRKPDDRVSCIGGLALTKTPRHNRRLRGRLL